MKIDIDKLDGHEVRAQIAGRSSCKSIDIVSRISGNGVVSEFVVKNKDEVVEITSNLLTAVKAFNQL